MYNEIDIEILRQYGYGFEQLIDLASLPPNSLESGFVRYIQQDIANPNNPFRVFPFNLFLVKDAPLNARAISTNGRYLMVIHHSLLRLLGDTIFRKFPKILPPGGKLNRVIETHTNHSLCAFVFQLVTLYIYNHELAHLNQHKNKDAADQPQLQEENYNLIESPKFNAVSHAMEIDADLFAATNVSISLFNFWKDLPNGERTAELLRALVALFGASIFFFYYNLQGGCVNSDHVDPAFWDVDPPAKQAIKVRA
jgi:hypothetical protein